MELINRLGDQISFMPLKICLLLGQVTEFVRDSDGEVLLVAIADWKELQRQSTMKAT